MSVNKVILVGNLGKEVDFKFLPNNSGVANITIATSDKWKDKQTGEQKEKTEWHRVVLFGKLAEIARDCLKKGSKVYIEGQLQTRKWTNQQGQDQYTTEIVVQGFTGVMLLLDSKSNQAPQQQGGYAHQNQPPPQQQGGYQQQAPQQQQYIIQPNHPNGLKKTLPEIEQERRSAQAQGYQVLN